MILWMEKLQWQQESQNSKYVSAIWITNIKPSICTSLSNRANHHCTILFCLNLNKKLLITNRFGNYDVTILKIYPDLKKKPTEERPSKPNQSNGYSITVSRIQDYSWWINIYQNKQIPMIKCQNETNVNRKPKLINTIFIFNPEKKIHRLT